MVNCIPVDGSPEILTNGGDVTITQDESQATVDVGGVIVRCLGVLISRFGYPNDEALHSDPLYVHGLKYYDIVEVTDSPWIREVNERNRVVFPDFKGYECRHYFMAFHDSSFEVLCDRLEFTKDDLSP